MDKALQEKVVIKFYKALTLLSPNLQKRKMGLKMDTFCDIIESEVRSAIIADLSPEASEDIVDALIQSRMTEIAISLVELIGNRKCR